MFTYWIENSPLWDSSDPTPNITCVFYLEIYIIFSSSNLPLLTFMREYLCWRSYFPCANSLENSFKGDGLKCMNHCYEYPCINITNKLIHIWASVLASTLSMDKDCISTLKTCIKWYLLSMFSLPLSILFPYMLC